MCEFCYQGQDLSRRAGTTELGNLLQFFGMARYQLNVSLRFILRNLRL
jgi:hypothetical protein